MEVEVVPEDDTEAEVVPEDDMEVEAQMDMAVGSVDDEHPVAGFVGHPQQVHE